MASEVLEALFTAKENISDALENIRFSSDVAGDGIDDFNKNLQNLNNLGLVSDETLDELRSSTTQMGAAMQTANESVDDMELTLEQLNNDLITNDEAMDRFRNSMSQMAASGRNLNRSIDNIQSELRELLVTGEITEGTFNRLSNDFSRVSISGGTAAEVIDDLNSELVETVVASKGAETAVSGFDNEVEDLNRSALAASGSLGLLSAAAQSSALSFGSLSVNIGPFNIALRNFLTQVPAIIAGMGTILALVTSLATAFLTLAGAAGALVGGGALLFFEDFSKQFEDSAEAAEVLMSALKDLFVDALEPLMTEANMDLFIDVINGAARVVNRFAQFFQQMRSEVMSFFGQVDGNIEGFFEALHDSFVIVEPVLLSFINFFLQEVPKAIVRFSKLTANISSDVGLIIASLGSLFNQLLDLVGVIISGVAPVIFLVVSLLADFFAILNLLPGSIGSTIVGLAALSLIVSKVALSYMNLKTAILDTIMGMTTQIATSGTLQATMATQGAIAQSLAAGHITLGQAIKWSAMSMWAYISSVTSSLATSIPYIGTLLSTAAAKLGVASAAGVATAAVEAFWAAISLGGIPALKAVIALIVALIAVVGSIVAVFLNWGAVTGFISGLISGLVDILVAIGQVLATVLIPFVNIVIALLSALGQMASALVGAFTSTIGKLLEMSGVLDLFKGGGDVFQGIINALDELGGLADWVISLLNMIPGVDIGGPAISASEVRAQIAGESEDQSSDDVQTESNVNLSFEESIENNVEMQADPEDKAQMSRIVKDALAEANSFSRRQQGGQ